MPFQTQFAANAVIIDDSNWQQHAGDGVVDGKIMSRGLEKRDFASHPFGSLGTPFDMPIIPRSEWDDRLNERAKQKASLVHLADYHGIPVKDQNGTNYCWCNGLIRGIELARAKAGQEYVELSPASVAAPIKGFRNVGGWAHEALNYCKTKGPCRSSLWPSNAIESRYDKLSEVAADRPNFVVAEWYEAPCDGVSERELFDMLATMIFNDLSVPAGYNWWGHLICLSDIVRDAKQKTNDGYGLTYDNSWSARYGVNGRGHLFGSKAIPDNVVVAPRVMVAA